jgi:hypothetical protein
VSGSSREPRRGVAPGHEQAFTDDRFQEAIHAVNQAELLTTHQARALRRYPPRASVDAQRRYVLLPDRRRPLGLFGVRELIASVGVSKFDGSNVWTFLDE